MGFGDRNSFSSASSTESVLVKRPVDDTTNEDKPNVAEPGVSARFDYQHDDLFKADECGPIGDPAELCNALDDVARVDLALHPVNTQVPVDSHPTRPAQDRDDTTGSNTLGHPQKPFHKWMRTLRRRALHRGSDPGLRTTWTPSERVSPRCGTLPSTPAHQRTSSSDSSFRFVVAAQSASNSMASVSMIARSRRKHLRSSKAMSKTDRSSRASMTVARLSEDSTAHGQPTSLDPAATQRCLQRRRILEELINTEEAYIGDIKFLLHVYVTLFASLPNMSLGMRSSINHNLTDILELHDEILGELHRVIPHSEYSQIEIPTRKSTQKGPTAGHHRWRSLDAVPEDRQGISWLHSVPRMTAEPQVAAEVARVFAKRMKRFFVYEEYSAKYELMIKDVASVHRAMPQWESYQKGLEALASTLDPSGSHSDKSRKALTIGDLLVKPIQRVCKYPLLFSELLKQTTVADCANSHMEIKSSLLRLREATAEINTATDDARIRNVLEKTWLLQDRLVFPNQRLDAVSKNCIRSFGHIQLCGVLHVCWQTRDTVSGQFMIILLYRDWLCLASASKADPIYTIQACVGLARIRLEEVDNGRGLQCHTAPFSWKVVFESDYQLYEIILTACTPKEELEWRSRLAKPRELEARDQADCSLFSSLAMDIRTLGTIFGKPGSMTRRLSVHRATTVGPKTPLCQVILRNTSAMKEANNPATSSSINRSQSLFTTNTRIPVLAPARADRARLEALLSDVWSRDVLPFPGMTAKVRSDHLVRNSASSMIRKLSVASIASSLSKRSMSHASLQRVASDDIALTAAEISRRHDNASHSAKEAGLHDSGAFTESNQAGPIGQECKMSTRLTPPLERAETQVPISRSISRLDAIRLEADSTTNLPALPVGALRTSSSNSARISRPGSALSKTSTSRTAEKENISRPDEDCAASVESKATGRWARVGGLHGGIMAKGLKSLFR